VPLGGVSLGWAGAWAVRRSQRVSGGAEGQRPGRFAWAAPGPRQRIRLSESGQEDIRWEECIMQVGGNRGSGDPAACQGRGFPRPQLTTAGCSPP